MDKYIFDLDKIKHFGVSGLLKKDSICEICKSDKQLLIHHNQNNQYFLCRRCHPKVHNCWWLKDVKEVVLDVK